MELPKRKQNRLTGYDYSTPNAYFITICTEKRENLLWEDVGAIIDRPGNVPLSSAGRIVDQCIKEIPKRYPAISVDRYVIMPNHIHLLLQIHSVGGGRAMLAPTEGITNGGRAMLAPTEGITNGGRAMLAPTISEVVRQMKGVASKKAGFPLWQKGFYDHVIRGDADYQEVWKYIEGNPGMRITDHHR